MENVKSWSDMLRISTGVARCISYIYIIVISFLLQDRVSLPWQEMVGRDAIDDVVWMGMVA